MGMTVVGGRVESDDDHEAADLQYNDIARHLNVISSFLMWFIYYYYYFCRVDTINMSMDVMLA